MKRILFLSLLALSGCATVKDIGREGAQDTVQISVTAQEAKACAQDDCALISRARLAEIKFQAFMLGGKQAAQDFNERLDSHGCVKGDI